jgi:hypothetical protein
MESSRLCPELNFKNTSSRQDRSKKEKPDIAVYWKRSGKYDGNQDLDFKAVDLWIENKNIPASSPAGDVLLSPGHANTSPLAVQRTKTQDYLKESGRCREWCPGRPCVKPYVHYRLVLETLGQPLNTFNSTRQLCEVIRDAIVGE